MHSPERRTHRILVVIPTYDERQNIASLMEEVLGQDEGIDVWVADDRSPDGTAEVVRSAARQAPERIRLIEGDRKQGRGAAVINAFRQGLADPHGYELFFEMDADFSHHPREIPKFLDKLRTHDMVVGSRYIPGGGTSQWGLFRPTLSWLANKYVAVVAGIPIRDTTSGYRAYRRPVLAETEFGRIRIRGYVVHGEIAYQAWVHGFRIGEVPIHFRNRARESSKLTLEEIYTAFFNFARLRFRYGFRPRTRAPGP